MKVEAKLSKFRETQTTVVNLFAGKVTKESLEHARGSVTEMVGAHNKLNDVYTKWYDKTHKEQKRRAAASGLGTSHK